ncbi:hypothetical protein LIER_37584 [Lithospermum erythrorhizon]|uniref:Uncharacterized protein n=1 Tax=Lithospermum erythrorhizon TaxID=34254 RepID=A0AAV3PMH2_LITER
MKKGKAHSVRQIPSSRDTNTSFTSQIEEDFDILSTTSTSSLPPPPYYVPNRDHSFHDIHVPLPPGGVFAIPPSSRGWKKNDDPFEIARNKCTKSNVDGKLAIIAQANSNASDFHFQDHLQENRKDYC